MAVGEPLLDYPRLLARVRSIDLPAHGRVRTHVARDLAQLVSSEGIPLRWARSLDAAPASWTECRRD